MNEDKFKSFVVELLNAKISETIYEEGWCQAGSLDITDDVINKALELYSKDGDFEVVIVSPKIFTSYHSSGEYDYLGGGVVEVTSIVP